MPYPDAGKALRQLVRTDASNIPRYRAELKYFHCPQRFILGMTTAYAVLDETHTWGQPGGMEAVDRFRRAFTTNAKAS